MSAPEFYVDAILRGELVAGVAQWRVLDESKRPEDAGHRPYGVLDVVAMADRVRVYHQPLDAIASLQVSSDDTYVRHGIAAGATAGYSYFDVFLATGTGTAVRPADACIPYSNVFCTGRGWITPPIGS